MLYFSKLFGYGFFPGLVVDAENIDAYPAGEIDVLPARGVGDRRDVYKRQGLTSIT